MTESYKITQKQIILSIKSFLEDFDNLASSSNLRVNLEKLQRVTFLYRCLLSDFIDKNHVSFNENHKHLVSVFKCNIDSIVNRFQLLLENINKGNKILSPRSNLMKYNTIDIKEIYKKKFNSFFFYIIDDFFYDSIVKLAHVIEIIQKIPLISIEELNIKHNYLDLLDNFIIFLEDYINIIKRFENNIVSIKNNILNNTDLTQEERNYLNNYYLSPIQLKSIDINDVTINLETKLLIDNKEVLIKEINYTEIFHLSPENRIIGIRDKLKIAINFVNNLDKYQNLLIIENKNLILNNPDVSSIEITEKK